MFFLELKTKQNKKRERKKKEKKKEIRFYMMNKADFLSHLPLFSGKFFFSVAQVCLNSWQSSCLSLWIAGVRGMSHHPPTFSQMKVLAVQA